MPTRFNDGTPVPELCFQETYEEIVAHFGAVTIVPQPVRGIWTHEGRRFEEDNTRFFVDVEDTPETERFFAAWKETLKRRFHQVEIWITSHEIRIT